MLKLPYHDIKAEDCSDTTQIYNFFHKMNQLLVPPPQAALIEGGFQAVSLVLPKSNDLNNDILLLQPHFREETEIPREENYCFKAWRNSY